MESLFKVRGTLLFLAFLLCISNGASARPSLAEAEVPDYDYTQTQLIVLYGEGVHVFLAPPFDFPAPAIGALVYEILLRYVAQFQEILIPLEEPAYVMDLIMEDRFGKRRIGQRLYLGDDWLSDGKGIAYLKPDDYRRLTGILDKRYSSSEHYSSELLVGWRRPKVGELPDVWLPESVSVQEAVNRMTSSEQHSHKEPEGQLPQNSQNENSLPEMGSGRNDAEEITVYDKSPSSSRAVLEGSTTDNASNDSVPLIPKNAVSKWRTSLEQQRPAAETAPPPAEGKGFWWSFLGAASLLAILFILVFRRRQLV